MSTNRRICRFCETRTTSSIGRTKDNKKKYRTVCNMCKRYSKLLSKEKLSQLICDGCHRTHHPSQIDFDHVDGDKDNTVDDNVQVLCANCHRLKTHLNSEYRDIKDR